MFRCFCPTTYADSAYAVDFQHYYEKGYRALVTDVDNTLVGHGKGATEEAQAFFESLRSMGFQTCILSNNHEPRVKPFADAVKSAYVCDAGKPSAGGYQRAMALLGSSPETTLFLGDQLFTDIWGANRAGVFSILVKPVEKDILLQIRLKRIGERIIWPFCRSQSKPAVSKA